MSKTNTENVNLETEESIQRLSRNIRWLRLHYGLSPTKMAAILGISETRLRRVEAGETTHRLCADHLIRLSQFFLLRITSLLDTELSALTNEGQHDVNTTIEQPGG